MTCLPPKATLCLLSPFISHYDPLLTTLSEDQNLTVRVLNIAQLDLETNQLNRDPFKQPHSLPEHYVLLVDARLNDETLFKLQSHPLLQQSQASALIFAPKQPNLMLLSVWDKLAGYFYDTTSCEQFHRDIVEILQGHNCLPKSLLLELFKHGQRVNKHQESRMLETRLSLTRRELEILSHLQMNQSNLDIADLLFVSEHTIKSHLYRIFKKINVSNRRQAISWAQLYLL